LIARGWSLIKTHDLVLLIHEFASCGLALNCFAEPAAILLQEYFEERYVSWQAEPALIEEEVRSFYPKWSVCARCCR
jgi:hypothetical protein